MYHRNAENLGDAAMKIAFEETRTGDRRNFYVTVDGRRIGYMFKDRASGPSTETQT